MMIQPLMSNINTADLKKFAQRLKKVPWKKFGEKTTFDVSSELQSQALRLLEKRVYGNPESENYQRTGNAKKAAQIKRMKEGKYRVINDTKIAGSDKDYNVFLNKNSKIPKLNTFYWNDAVKYTRRIKAPNIIKNNIRILLDNI